MDAAVERRRRVFILYHNRLFAEGVESLLQHDSGVEVVGVEVCGRSALELVQLAQPDVVVLDGDEHFGCSNLVPRLLQDNPSSRVLCLSMSDNNIEVYHKHQVLAHGGEDLISAIYWS